MTDILADLRAEIDRLTAEIDALQARHDALVVKPGERPTPEAADEMADIRIARDRLRVERSKVDDQLREARRAATRTLTFILADPETSTFEKAYEPILVLLMKLRDEGIITDWEWNDA